MIYSNLEFLVAFPFFCALFWLIPAHRARLAALLVASLAFYAYGEPFGIPLLVGVGALAWGAGLLIGAHRARARLIAAAAIAALVGDLALFKLSGALPLGISFYTFEAIAYVVDVLRGAAPVERSPLRLGLFVSVFPHLISGPIMRPNDILPRLARGFRFDAATFASGIELFVEGMAKKRLLADTAGIVADSVFADPAGASTARAWVGVLAYTAQIYGDFAGYTDMGRGIARMLGFELPLNFAAPYTASSIRDFWRRWHISLSSWLRDYLYIPLGGDRKGHARTYFNLMVTMALGGLWHGAGPTFVLWGCYHGALLALERLTGWLGRLPAAMAGAVTFFLVVNGWALFRAHDLGTATEIFRALYGMRDGAPASTSLLIAGVGPLAVILAGMIAVRVRPALVGHARAFDAVHGMAYALAIWVIFFAAPAPTQPFIYFRF